MPPARCDDATLCTLRYSSSGILGGGYLASQSIIVRTVSARTRNLPRPGAIGFDLDRSISLLVLVSAVSLSLSLHSPNPSLFDTGTASSHGPFSPPPPFFSFPLPTSSASPVTFSSLLLILLLLLLLLLLLRHCSRLRLPRLDFSSFYASYLLFTLARISRLPPRHLVCRYSNWPRFTSHRLTFSPTQAPSHASQPSARVTACPRDSPVRRCIRTSRFTPTPPLLPSSTPATSRTAAALSSLWHPAVAHLHLAMVLQYAAQPFYRAANLTVDTSHAQQKYTEDEDKSVLDDGILDPGAVDSGLELSPPMVSSRRESFAVGSALFSPKSEGWHSVDMQSLPSNNPFVDAQGSTSSSNPFARLDHNQQQVFGQHQAGGWLVGHGHGSGSGSGSGAATPFPTFDHVPTTEYDSGVSIFQRQMQNQTPFGGAGNNIFGPIGHGDQSMPTSPQKEWMAANKKMRPGSPVIRSHNDMRRGDGIRKKNARFEIPAERNLSNIDQLISQSTDDQEIKELKQQKRLLRNRQAALDSRQRKKQHTERLEDEKKQFTALVTDMEEEISSLKAKMDQLLREKQSYSDYIETLTLEKDEMIRAHTLETGVLRKKLGVITDHVQRLESNAMTQASHSFGDDYDGMGDIAMAGGWDNAGFLNVNDYAVEAPPVKQHMAVVKKNEAPTPEGDKGAVSQGGLLFMLFLVGAFVMSSRSTPAIPQVSEDVRAASATLLDNVLKDAGVSSQSHGLQPSGSSWPQPAPSMGVAPSMLEELGDSLTQPTEEQTNEQIFSLTAAEYSNHQDYGGPSPTRPPSHGRKNLADALASMRAANKQTGAAEVYTRSLLWDQIPSEVVRNFAKMVAECSNAQNEQPCHETTT
ncbi:hypothetical protein XA68_16057 [Ophiocordyceps unilateralis]|uniref:BZIP domain-containing protein n=1 Tax=Ophiocordyceps unilateralis TaxID=268505 RepID=A0A2A9P787_OPHUN|nr:hypothetical protein XA68_16057 [Ophiocordyceps unilateralis]